MNKSINISHPNDKIVDGEFSYKRRFLMKDLFNPKQILSDFQILEFENVSTFFNYVSKDLASLIHKQTLIINIKTEEDLPTLFSVFDNTEIAANNYIVLDIPESLVEYAASFLKGDKDTKYKIFIRMNIPTVKKLTKMMKENKKLSIHGYFLFGNGATLDVTLHKDNYAEMYEELIPTVLANTWFRVIDLKFDYISFESATMSDLHSLFFYVNQIRQWCLPNSVTISNNPFNVDKSDFLPNVIEVKKLNDGCGEDDCKCAAGEECDDKDNCSCDNPVTPKDFYQGSMLINNRNTVLKAFLDENLDLYLSPKADKPYFEFSKYLEEDGNTMTAPVLDKLRQIVDVKYKNAGFKNMYLVDLHQNIEIMKDPYMIPYITSMIGKWLEIN